jgi:hypothetical protein
MIAALYDAVGIPLYIILLPITVTILLEVCKAGA